MRTLTILSLVTFSTLVSACVADDTSDDAGADQVDSAAGKADGSYPGGVFNINSTTFHAGEISKLTLSDDKTFSRTLEGFDCHNPGFSCLTAKGTYTFSHSGSTKYIRFLDTAGTLIDRFAYKVGSNDNLSLRVTGETTWFGMTNADNNKLRSGEVCADDKENSLGQCPDNLACNYDGPDGTVEECLPEI